MTLAGSAMPICGMFLTDVAARDIHLIRGDVARNTSRVLRDAGLFFEDSSGNGVEPAIYLAAHNDVHLEFRPTFKFVENAATGMRENFGIHVHREHGVVTVDNGPIPMPKPANFIVEIIVTHVGVTPALPPIPPLTVRVHVHDGVDRIWITPSHMTVRRRVTGLEPTDYRFTVRARFTDGGVGDITLLHGVRWAPAVNFVPAPATSDLGELASVGRLRLPAGAVAGPVSVTASWDVGGTTFNAPGTFSVEPPWTTASPNLPTVDLLTGSPATWIGNDAEKFINILLLGAGFTAGAEIGVFQQTAVKVASDLSTDPMLRPYDVLKDSINIWSAALPAANGGVSVRSLVYLPLIGHDEYAFIVPKPVPHPGGAASWKLSHVLYALGLPLPSYSTALRPTGETGFTTLKAFWDATAQTPMPATIDSGILRRWFELSSACFIDEVDSYPAISVGEPPGLGRVPDLINLNVHPDRGGATALPQFLSVLAATRGQGVPTGNIGRLWTSDDPSFTFDNRPLVALVAAGSGGAVRRDSAFFAPLEPGFVYRVAAVANGQVRLNRLGPLRVPTRETFPEYSRLFAHEMSHAFHLLDEYASVPITLFCGPAANFALAANVASLDSVTSAGRVESRLIKWNWDRMTKVAVLRGSVIAAGGPFDIPVVAGQEQAFTAGDVVRLRQRAQRTPLSRAIDTPTTSAALQLTVASVSPGVVRVTSGAASLGDFSPFSAGSLVYVPVRAPSASATGPFLALISPKIAAVMDASGNPLTGTINTCDPVEEARRGNQDQIPELPAGTLSLRWSLRNVTRITGLYTGGATFGCGAFHPAGACMMRNHFRDVAQFCDVCRYALVDFINPVHHGELEADREWIYPL